MDTTSLFDQGFTESNTPPIDTFISKIGTLSMITNPTHYDSLAANLIILGSVSAVESYMREVIRKCVILDSESRIKCEKLQLTYGAAISHDKTLMPEAILESYSFTSKSSVVNSLRELLGIKGNPDNSVDEALNEYGKVCHLRHCLVHRYGKLGTRNAIELGLDKHKKCIEKPLDIDFSSLQDCQAICLSVVKEINNYIFRKLLLRLILDDKNKKMTTVVWKWNYNQDRKLFLTYYNVLVSNSATPSTHLSAKNAYDKYRIFYNSL
ncbi:MAG: hypothetical protein JKZ00_00315 [Flavobacteriaceae bacterium]|nr:hypothetical protein [Flavobacteriaceae bacterium]